MKDNAFSQQEVENILAYVVPVGKEGYPAEIPVKNGSSLAGLQNCVAGCIEAVDCGVPGVDVWVNEEGLLSKLPLNRAIFANDYMAVRYVSQIDGNRMESGDLFYIVCGDMVCTGVNIEGESVSLSRDQLEQLDAVFKDPLSGEVAGSLVKFHDDYNRAAFDRMTVKIVDVLGADKVDALLAALRKDMDAFREDMRDSGFPIEKELPKSLSPEGLRKYFDKLSDGGRTAEKLTRRESILNSAREAAEDFDRKNSFEAKEVSSISIER